MQPAATIHTEKTLKRLSTLPTASVSRKASKENLSGSSKWKFLRWHLIKSFQLLNSPSGYLCKKTNASMGSILQHFCVINRLAFHQCKKLMNICKCNFSFATNKLWPCGKLLGILPAFCFHFSATIKTCKRIYIS